MGQAYCLFDPYRWFYNWSGCLYCISLERTWKGIVRDYSDDYFTMFTTQMIRVGNQLCLLTIANIGEGVIRKKVFSCPTNVFALFYMAGSTNCAGSCCCDVLTIFVNDCVSCVCVTSLRASREIT